MDVLIEFLHSVAYKFPKGYPDMNNKQDKEMLFQMVNEIVEKYEALNEDVPNKKATIQAVKKVVDAIGAKYGAFQGKSKPQRLGFPGKHEPQFFVDLFKEVFGTDLEVKIIPPSTSPNPSNSFNMYTFTPEGEEEVNIVVSSQPPGGKGKKNEADFLDNINNLIQENGGSATIKLVSPEYTLSYDNITSAKDSSLTGAGKGDKSDAQFLSGDKVISNISLKQDGGFRWASVASIYKDFIKALINKAINGELTDLSLKPNPNNPQKYLMFDPQTGNRVTKVVIPDFPKDDINNWVFGPEEPKVIIVSKTWSEKDFSLEDGVITANATHIYKTLEDLEKDKMDPVFAIMQHIGTSSGLDFRIIPSKMANISANVREVSYNEVMS